MSPNTLYKNSRFISVYMMYYKLPLSQEQEFIDRLNPKSKYYDATFPRPVKFGERKKSLGKRRSSRMARSTES